MLKNLAKEFTRRWTRQSLEVDNFADSPYYGQSDLERWATDKARYLRTNYLDYPALVHMETVAVCNAACNFCPYTELDRKGTRMPDALIEKIIDDLSDIPRDLQFHLSPYKVSDPFLESRLFDIMARVNEKLPNATISLITNGSALTERNINQLTQVENVAYLSVSLNFCDPVEYEEVMKLPLERTLARLEILGRMHAQGKINFPLRITRVSVSDEEDRVFLQWCKDRFPAFRVCILPRNDWIGVIDAGNFTSLVPDIACHRWFDLSITATGVVAMCCMDSKAAYPKGDVNRDHVLDIYNQPWLRNLREQLISRRAAGGPCERCTYLSY